MVGRNAPDLLWIDPDLLHPLGKASRSFYVAVACLGTVVLWALFCWGYQLYWGIGVAGINRPVFWGVYITNFVFWIGISHAGTLISAILRITDTEWRRPVTRCAEAITVFALLIGALFPIIHLGRAWKFYWLIPYPNERGLWPNFRSPLVWDFLAITTYFVGSTVYLYLPLIPDLALVRDRTTGWRRWLYEVLSFGWTGTPREWQSLEWAISTMAVVIIPVAVSVHTIVSWDFAMAIAPMWHSTIFGPYFVVGAIYSGVAALIVVMVILRRVLHLEAYLLPLHFNYLGLLLLTMACAWLYFTFAEHLTVWYGRFPEEMAVFQAKVSGPFAGLFWVMVTACFLLPVPLLAFPRTRTVAGCFVAAVGVLIGMWLERFLIIVPTLSHPRLSSAWGTYTPTWVELSITAGTFAAFALLYVLFAKLFPIISIWEVKGETLRAKQTEPERKSHIPLFALGGGLLGAAAGLSLAVLTATAMQLPTGGMPIVAWPTVGIVTFELAALGAIVMTLIRFVWEKREAIR